MQANRTFIRCRLQNKKYMKRICLPLTLHTIGEYCLWKVQFDAEELELLATISNMGKMT
jgi:hypothetical protein